MGGALIAFLVGLGVIGVGWHLLTQENPDRLAGSALVLIGGAWCLAVAISALA